MPSSNLSRRAILAGTSAMPIIALAGAPCAASGTAADRRLFEIESNAARTQARTTIAGQIHDDAEKAMFEWQRRNPKPKMRETRQAKESQVDDYIRALQEADDPSKVKAALRMDPNADLKAAVAEHADALNRWSKRQRLAAANCRIDQREAAFENLIDQVEALLDEAAGIRATTIAGLQCKARLIEVYHKLSNPDNTLVPSILSDLLALSAGA